MNTRIKELIEQATTEEQDGFRYFDKQQFAELVIRETVRVIGEQRNPANLNYRPTDAISEAVLQYWKL